MAERLSRYAKAPGAEPHHRRSAGFPEAITSNVTVFLFPAIDEVADER
jgi:hypothetical protein